MSTPDIAESFGTGDWEFTPQVVQVFDEHVRASVPHYDVFQDLVVAASDWLVPANGTVVDIGASTGTTVAAMLDRHPARNAHAHLYDESATMLAQARQKIGEENLRVKYHARRVETGPLDHDAADFTVSLFTLQFMPYPARIRTLRAARSGSAASGALFVAEKLRLPDSRWAELAGDLSHDWKAENGIADTAIRAKAQALRGVLRPYSMDALLASITTAGWVDPEVIFRWHQWVLVGAFATHDGR
jgi:tRNA (cmo5U34)-methyltransferase